jgi:hypothetical protein
MNEAKVHPLSLLNPFHAAEKLSATDDNEPGRKERILVGYAKDGTAIYGRNPVGKIGEEFSGYFGSPIDMLRKKQGTIARPLFQILSNDAGFGRKVYDPTADTAAKYAGNIWAIVKHLVGSQLPEGQITAFSDLVKGEGDAKVNALQAFGPFAGVTFSKGAPGGPQVGEMYASKSQHDFAVNQALPDIRRQIRRGDTEGAIGRMTELDIPQGLQRYYIKTTLNPALRMSPRAVRDFYLHATDEQKARFERAQQARPSPDGALLAEVAQPSCRPMKHPPLALAGLLALLTAIERGRADFPHGAGSYRDRPARGWRQFRAVAGHPVCGHHRQDQGQRRRRHVHPAVSYPVTGITSGKAMCATSADCQFGNVYSQYPLGSVSANPDHDRQGRLAPSGRAPSGRPSRSSLPRPGLTGSPITITYTAIGGDTTTTIATGLCALVNANTTLHGTGGKPIFCQSLGSGGVFNLQYDSAFRRGRRHAADDGEHRQHRHDHAGRGDRGARFHLPAARAQHGPKGSRSR